MKRPDDETLMAYADGLLDTKEREEIAALLEHDSQARETVAMFERSSQIVAGFGDEALNAPVPAGLIALLSEGGPAKVTDLTNHGEPRANSTAPKTATILQMQPRRRVTWPTSARDLAAVAACLTLVAGATLAWLARPDAGGQNGSAIVALGPVPSNGVLASLLEQRPSYQPVPLPSSSGQPSALVAMSTFRDRSERYCREFELTSGADQLPLSVGVACRNGSGVWTVEGVVKTAGAADAKPGAIKPASGVPETAALDGLMSMLGASPALSKEDEKAILARRWK